MLFVNANNLEVASFYVSSDLKVELINDQKNLVFSSSEPSENETSLGLTAFY